MGKSELSLETGLYRFGWGILIFLSILISAKHFFYTDIFPEFQMPPCVFHTLTGYYCPGCGGTRSLKALLSGKWLVCAVDFPMIFYAAVVYAWFMISQTIERVSRHRIPIGMKYRHAWVYASLVIVVIHFVVKNLFYIKTGIEPFL